MSLKRTFLTISLALAPAFSLADGSDDMLEKELVTDFGPTFLSRSIDVEEGSVGMRLPDGTRLPPRFQASSGTVDPGTVELNPAADIPIVIGVDADRRRRHRRSRSSK
ncbi:MAG: hypothetical protein AAGA88_13695 [Pseudomonadota bacterium]